MTSLIRISYSNVPINLFGVKSSIKVVTDWSVSIEPKSINIFGEILRLKTSISSNYREYTALMKFLTSTGLNILDIIDLDDNHYHDTKCRIFDGCNTNILQQILDHLHTYYGQETNCAGHNTIRYLLIHLREDTLSKVLPNQFDKLMTSSLYLPSRCYPFDRNPFISNLTKSKTTKMDLNELIEVCHNSDKIQTVSPYLRIEHLIRETKEIFFDPSTIATDDEIDNYNASLDQWERRNGFVVLTGSTINATTTKACPDSAIKNRAKYGKSIDENFTLTDDLLFSSPSGAAAFVGGSALSGNELWKDQNGTKLKDMLEITDQIAFSTPEIKPEIAFQTVETTLLIASITVLIAV